MVEGSTVSLNCESTPLEDNLSTRYCSIVIRYLVEILGRKSSKDMTINSTYSGITYAGWGKESS